LSPPLQNESVRARLVRLAAPVVGLNLLNVTVLFVDTAMCSRLPEKTLALEALSFAGQLVFLFTVLMMGLTVGTVALVARAHGAGDRLRASHLLVQSTQLTVLVGILVAIVGDSVGFSLVRALGAGPEAARLAMDYLRPLFTFSVFYFLTILYAAVLRGVGETVLPFVVSLGWNALNVALNYIFIFGNFGAPRLGVAGASISTVIAQGVGVVVLVFLLARGRVAGLTLSLRPERFDVPLTRELFRLGAPAALDMVILNVSFISLVWMLGLIDGTAVAAHGVGLRVQNLAFVPALGIAQATGALVGNALGARLPNEARAVTRSAVGLAALLMTALGLVLVLGAPWLVEVPFAIERDTALHRYCVLWLRVLGFGMPIVGSHVALVGTLRGAGATRTSLGINLLGTCFVQVPLSLLLGFALGFGPIGIWVALPVSYVAKLGLSIVAYRRGSWARLGTSA
jgi:putative MATE family efflux protein